ncbi:glucosyl-dolichyl phosphate glucuronosyltransferase [Natronoarchaeum sp. GCM10025321]|uniref:glucosyl-dolichyl phosphate glucuronosyltransferase n=1 Tax=Natronoarchaeum sp. GCM10025321 TaxID=3252684 RepID=UPI0036125426
MHVSVVVCTYTMDRYDAFTEAVESILEQTYEPIEIVLVIDGNPRVFERAVTDFGEHEHVIVHDNDENRGISYSRTKGAELASGDIVAFIDDDAVAEEDWIDTLVRTYEEHDALAAGGRMVGEWLVGRPWFLPEEFDWVVGVTYPGFAEPDTEVRNTFESNISFRRDVFLDIGGFDESLGRDANSYSNSEGAEVGDRLRAEYGRGVVYNPEAVVAHKVFERRTKLPWLLSRAFEQGVSKRRMAGESDGVGSEETGYLKFLFTERVPERIRETARSPSVAAVGQLLMIGVFTAAVGVGYLYEAVVPE